MAEITEVKVNYGVTKNMGNFESLRLDYSVTRTLDDEESPKEVLKDLSGKLQKMVNEDVSGRLKRGF